MSTVGIEKSGELTPRKRKAAYLLADGLQTNEVAKTLEVSVESIRLWRKEEPFKAYFNDLLVKIEEEAVFLLRSRNSLAVSTITELMGADQPAQVRLKAATEVLNLNRFPERIDGSSISTEASSVANKIKSHQRMLQISETLVGFIQTKSQTAPDGKVIDVSPDEEGVSDGTT